jgi:hypothetical protein
METKTSGGIVLEERIRGVAGGELWVWMMRWLLCWEMTEQIDEQRY